MLNNGYAMLDLLSSVCRCTCPWNVLVEVWNKHLETKVSYSRMYLAPLLNSKVTLLMMSAFSLTLLPFFYRWNVEYIDWSDTYYLHILINKENDYLASSHFLIHMFLPYINKWACMGVLGSVGNFWTRDCISRGSVYQGLNRLTILLTSHFFTANVMKSLHIPKGVRRVLFRTLNTDR